MRLIDKAKNLLEWNVNHLVHGSVITNEAIATLFAKQFVVKANGRTYPADYDNYRDFTL